MKYEEISQKKGELGRGEGKGRNGKGRKQRKINWKQIFISEERKRLKGKGEEQKREEPEYITSRYKFSMMNASIVCI